MERDPDAITDAVSSIFDSDTPSFEIAGDTYSVDSSITRYRMENGRRYHSYRDNYWCPNDERQNENLDIAHHKFLLILDGNLTLAPIAKDIERVLDIGTGTGIWAIDFAEEYPNTAVLGTDLSPIQPSLVPPNCRFEIDDVQDDWIYPDDYFDFVHIRCLFGSVEDWGKLYKQAHDHLKPGGFIEQVEISIDIISDDGTVEPGCALYTFAELFTEAGEITGRTFRTYGKLVGEEDFSNCAVFRAVAHTMRKGIEEAGFVNVTEKVFKSPLGGWAADPKLRESGQWSLLEFDTGLEGYAMSTYTNVMGWNTVEVHVFLAQVRAIIRDKKIHTYHDIKVVYAQKPPIK